MAFVPAGVIAPRGARALENFNLLIATSDVETSSAVLVLYCTKLRDQVWGV